MFSGGRNKPGGAKPRERKSGPGGLSFIGGDVVVSGDIASAAQIHIDGRIEGNVRCEVLIQGEGGTIAGNIVADSVHLSGLVDGTVKARLVTLEPSARVTGDVSYETLSIAAGATIDGRLSRKEGALATEPEANVLAAAPLAEKKRVRPATPQTASLLPHLDAPAPAAAAG